MRFPLLSPNAGKKAVWGRSLLAVAFAVLFALPVAAQTPDITTKFDDAVQEAWKTGSFSRVIMRFATIAERDRAFGELLDHGAAVRVMDDEESPSLNVLATPAVFGAIDYTDRVSYDAPVTLSSLSRAAQKVSAARAARRGARARRRRSPRHSNVNWPLPTTTSAAPA